MHLFPYCSFLLLLAPTVQALEVTTGTTGAGNRHELLTLEHKLKQEETETARKISDINALLNDFNAKLTVCSQAQKLYSPMNSAGADANGCVSPPPPPPPVQITKHVTAAPKSCGVRSHNSTWSESCPSGQSGSRSYKCYNGSTSLVSNSCRTTYTPPPRTPEPTPQPPQQPAGCIEGRVKVESCPAGYSGQNIWRCINGAGVKIHDGCRRIYRDCPPLKHGQSGPGHCPADRPLGSSTWRCDDGRGIPVADNCYAPGRWEQYSAGTFCAKRNWNRSCRRRCAIIRYHCVGGGHCTSPQPPEQHICGRSGWWGSL